MRTRTGHIHPLSARVGARIERFSALVLCAFLATAFFFAQPALAIDASIVVDANSDKVISQMNPDRLLHPASMSKLMTLYLTFEALESGRLSLQRNLSVSEHAQICSIVAVRRALSGSTVSFAILIASSEIWVASDTA